MSRKVTLPGPAASDGSSSGLGGVVTSVPIQDFTHSPSVYSRISDCDEDSPVF